MSTTIPVAHNQAHVAMLRYRLHDTHSRQRYSTTEFSARIPFTVRTLSLFTPRNASRALFVGYQSRKLQSDGLHYSHVDSDVSLPMPTSTTVKHSKAQKLSLLCTHASSHYPRSSSSCPLSS